MFRKLFVVACLAGCGEEPEQPEWSVRVEQDAVDGWVRASSTATRASDGSFLVTLWPSRVTRVRIGELMLQGPQLVRVGPHGEIADVVPIGEGGGSGSTRMWTDDFGNVVVRWGDSIFRYNPSLVRDWTRPFMSDFSAPIDVSPQGEVAVVLRGAAESAATLQWIHSDGTLAWEAKQAQILAVRFATNGDLFVFGAGHRWRYDAVGTVVDDLRITSGTDFVEPDGSWLDVWELRDESAQIDRYDDAGQFLWSKTLPYDVSNFPHIFSTTETVFIGSHEIDVTTGNDRAADACDMWLVAVDAERCVGFSQYGLSQFRRH